MKLTEIIERIAKLGVSRAALLSAMLLLTVGGYAQSECFTYEDESTKTVISGLTTTGQAATELTIPATVTTVKSGAFQYASSLTSLTVADGGNPAFESGLFGGSANPLTYIDMGDGMSVANMVALLKSVGTMNAGTSIVASGFSGVSDATDATWNAVTWTNVTSVTLPAELVAPTSYGSATVYGRFSINKEVISFCTSATFLDADQGSNMLFYVADYQAADGRLHIQRVKYIAAGKGVLIHRTGSSSGSCLLPRTQSLDDAVAENIAQAITDKALYDSNMLVGVTVATPITATSGDNTNYVLKDGAFHPTSGGNIKANRAYLQIPSSISSSALHIDFGEEEEEGGEVNGVIEVNEGKEVGEVSDNSWYTINGLKLDTKPATKGLYIHNGKKYVIR